MCRMILSDCLNTKCYLDIMEISNEVVSFLYPGGLRPDRRAPGDFAEEGAFQNIFLLIFDYVF